MTHIDGRSIQDARLGELTLACPECGAAMSATGRMRYSAIARRWLVEYRCPADRQVHEIWTPEADALTRQVAGQHARG